MLKKIAIVGPESTGKSTLAAQLAAHYQTVWVEEYARTYLDKLNRPYNQSDLVDIAKGQLQWEAEAAAQANKFLFCDTNLLIIKVWSEYIYGDCDPFILQHMNLDLYDLHFLTGIDIPWVYDPHREHPHKRQELWNIYRRELEIAGVNVVEINGKQQARLEKAIAVLDSF